MNLCDSCSLKGNICDHINTALQKCGKIQGKICLLLVAAADTEEKAVEKKA